MTGRHVFISYKHEEHALNLVLDIQHRLCSMNYEVWFDHHLEGGIDWRNQIDEKIDNAFIVLVIITPGAINSAYVLYEWAYALGAKKKVIPVILSANPEHMHPRMTTMQYRDFRSHRNRQWELLINDVKKEARSDSRKRDEQASMLERIKAYFLRDELPKVNQSYISATDGAMLRRFIELEPRKLLRHLKGIDLVRVDSESGNLRMLQRMLNLKDFAEIKLIEIMDDKHLAFLLLEVCNAFQNFRHNQHDTPTDELVDPSEIENEQAAMSEIERHYNTLFNYVDQQYPTFKNSSS